MSEMFDGMEEALDGAQEPTVVKENEEYKIRILDVKKGVTAADKGELDYLMPRFEVCGEPFSKDFNHFLFIPNRENKAKMNDEKKFNKSAFSMKEFMAAFDIDPSRPGDPEDDWAGKEGWAILGVSDNEQYGKQNFIKKFVTPK